MWGGIVNGSLSILDDDEGGGVDGGKRLITANFDTAVRGGGNNKSN